MEAGGLCTASLGVRNRCGKQQFSVDKLLCPKLNENYLSLKKIHHQINKFSNGRSEVWYE